MGQRLNIEVVCGDRVLANAYYHWSAYSSSAIYLTQKAIDTYNESESKLGIKLAIAMLESTGAGVNTPERVRIESSDRYKRCRFRDAIDRNEGLLAVTEDGIEETRRWEEGRVTIDLETQTIRFDVMYIYSKQEYEDEVAEYYDDMTYDELPQMDIDVYEIPFDDLFILQEYVDNYHAVRTMIADEVVCWIE